MLCRPRYLLGRSRHPRVDVDGRFDRASRLAEERGTRQQQLRCAYDRAWTNFWWYDDFASFNRVYETVEKLAQGASQTSDLELVQNLWQLLYASVINGHIGAAEGRLDERTSALKGELERLQKDQFRPSAALYAFASLLLVDLFKSYDNAEESKGSLENSDVSSKAGLIDFPALPIRQDTDGLGERFLKTKPLTMRSLQFWSRASAESSVVSGRMLLRRGTQKLKGKRPYRSNSTIGACTAGPCIAQNPRRDGDRSRPLAGPLMRRRACCGPRAGQHAHGRRSGS